MPYTYEYPAHYVAVDPVIFGVNCTRTDCQVKVLLVERLEAPFKGCWALPGGFVEPKESVDAAAARELEEETGVTGAFLEQLYTQGEPGRDPRGRVISVAYYALVKISDCKVQAGSDAAAAQWFDVGDLPDLAFDHADTVRRAIERLRAKVRYKPIGFSILPESFTLSQMQALYEGILGRSISSDAFRKTVVRMRLLTSAGIEAHVSHRPAKLYRFNEQRYEALVRRGFNFEI